MSERKAIKFFKSYYEVAKELPKKHQGEFILAILRYQFEHIEPNFSGILKLAWISQKHSLDKQIEGFRHGVKAKELDPPPKGPSEGPLPVPPQQEEDKEQVQVKDKEKEKGQPPPPIQDVITYFTQNGYTEESAIKFYEYYEVEREDRNGNVWKDSKGNTIRNWKQKARGVWFKPQNLQQNQNGHSWKSRYS